VYDRREVHTGFWWGDPRKEVHLGDLGVDGRMILKLIFENLEDEACTELLWVNMVLVNALMNLRVR